MVSSYGQCWKVKYQIKTLIARENHGIETINIQFKFKLSLTFMYNLHHKYGFHCNILSRNVL